MIDFPRSLIEFQHGFPDECACAAYLADARWPDGFRCPDCGHDKGWETGQLSERPLARANAFHMVQRRARAAGVKTQIGCHAFRATGITIYLTNGGVPGDVPADVEIGGQALLTLSR